MSCLEMVKIPIGDTDFNDISTNSKRGFEPFGLDDRVHYFRHPVNEFSSLFHWTGIPNARQSVVPHDHCSPLVGVLLHPFYVLLRDLKIINSFFKMKSVSPMGILTISRQLIKTVFTTSNSILGHFF